MEQNDSATLNVNGNEINCDTIGCFVSTAELLCPKKRAKVSTITIGYFKGKHPDQLEKNQQFWVLFDSECSATMIDKRFVKHWKKMPVKAIKWSIKAGSFKTKRSCNIEFTLPHCVPKTSRLQHPGQIVCPECKKQPHNIGSKNINAGSNLWSTIEMKNDLPVMLSGQHSIFFFTIWANTFRSMPDSGHV
jgi:hypothetical protein